MFADGTLREPNRDHVVRNPYNGEVVGAVCNDSDADVDRLLAAFAAHETTLASNKRSEILLAVAARLSAERDRLADLITAESGVALRETRKEVERACGNLQVAAQEVSRIRGESIPLETPAGPKLAVTLREPVGLIAAITPFNRPLNQVVVKVAPALAAGNRVVVKPSDKTPLTALRLAQIFSECGLPPGLLAVVTGDGARLGSRLAASELVGMVTFTGSVEVGRQVQRAAGLKRVALELGGNDPLIVLADADLDHALRLAVAGAYATAGQSCRGIKRILVADSIADRFAERLVEATRALRCGDPRDPATDVGPLISADAAARIEAACSDAVRRGARLLLGGTRRNALMTPTVLDHVPASAPLVQDETFGPVAPIIRIRSVEHAIAVANGTIYGLQAGVVTDSADSFRRLATGLKVGAVNLMDGPNFDSPYIPFGGVKCSGIGREGIRYSIEEMTQVKTVVYPWS